MTRFQINLVYWEMQAATQRMALERLINAERLVRRLRRVNALSAAVLGFNVALLVYNVLRIGPVMAAIILGMTATLLLALQMWKRIRRQ